ncbi:MAG: isocitrate/isopropylmalate family dehydrogenase, partial [Firmicutes bacterium]|nr:isocitrate/isopropylmalate family dehydrogenase [Bacillota bacterium]
LEKNKIGLKGPITTPIGKGFRSINVSLRQKFNLYACVRPYKSMLGINSRYENVDIVVVRENTEDLYKGVEFEANSEEARVISKLSNGSVSLDSAISIKAITARASEKIGRYAFEYAKKHGRKKVTASAKANIMKFTDGLFYDSLRKVAKEYPEIEYHEVLVDALCMKLVQNPEHFDVLVMSNLYGDLLSDLVAGLVGGLGVAPGANIGDNMAIFEATHGSAPDIAGKDLANPLGLLLSANMMLEYLGEKQIASNITKAIETVLADGKFVTKDLNPEGVTTSQMTKAIIKAL